MVNKLATTVQITLKNCQLIKPIASLVFGYELLRTCLNFTCMYM